MNPNLKGKRGPHGLPQDVAETAPGSHGGSGCAPLHHLLPSLGFPLCHENLSSRMARPLLGAGLPDSAQALWPCSSLSHREVDQTRG